MTNTCEVANKSPNLQINDLNVEIILQSDRIGTRPLIIEKHNNLNDHSKKIRGTFLELNFFTILVKIAL